MTDLDREPNPSDVAEPAPNRPLARCRSRPPGVAFALAFLAWHHAYHWVLLGQPVRTMEQHWSDTRGRLATILAVLCVGALGGWLLVLVAC